MTARNESWRNNTASARREHIFGPIQSLAYEAEKAGEMGWVKGSALTLGVFLAIGLAATALSPSAEPVPVSSASPLQSLSQGAG